MFCRLSFSFSWAPPAYSRAPLRYEILEKFSRACKRRGVPFLAFGLGDHEIRFLIEASHEQALNLSRSFKVSHLRQMRRHSSCPQWCAGGVVSDLQQASFDTLVAWTHRVSSSMASAALWTSRFDLLGYRQAAFFNPHPTLQKLTILPHPLTNIPQPDTGKLHDLMALSAEVTGVPPGNRKAFRLFVHLGKQAGWPNEQLSKALVLTPRRIRQLAATPEPKLPIALRRMPQLNEGTMPNRPCPSARAG